MLIFSLISCKAIANDAPELPGDTDKKEISFMLNQQNFTLLDATQYKRIVETSRANIKEILANPHKQDLNSNTKLRNIINLLLDIPYLNSGAMGEGDWQADQLTYAGNALHVRQDPVYRTDGLDCQTFVQVAMALLYSKNLAEFDHNIIKIAYGAAGNPNGEMVRFYNRNNFVDGDWNPINRANGFLRDAHLNSLKPYSSHISATITRQAWFQQMQANVAGNVRILDEKNGEQLAERFRTLYTDLKFPNFDRENVQVAYLPKEAIAHIQPNGEYHPNNELLSKIPTPAVIEIVRDPNKWMIGGKKIKEIIGSELTISHMGLLYRKSFNAGDLIYHQIRCEFDVQRNKVCSVQPIYCTQDGCDILMYAHATQAYPNNYYWYQKENGEYTCSPTLPSQAHVPYTHCNRVETLPLFEYLTSFQYGAYRYMNNASILGVHIEALK